MVDTADVVIIGAGPVGQTAAALLAAQGVDVVVYERFRHRYDRPRAIRFDHEVMRIWQSLSIADEMLEDAAPVESYDWFGEDGQPIVSFEFPEGPSGWPLSYVFFQPHLETTLEGALAARSVEVQRGWTLTEVSVDSDGVDLTLHATADPSQPAGPVATRQVRAKYVVAADGAHSGVARQLGVQFEDLGFSEPWFVVDIKPTDPDLLLPRVPQQYCVSARPHMTSPNGRHHQRWEFMLLPGERPEDFDDAGRVWSMLAPWIAPEQGEMVRHAVYEFESKIASTMRVGRCLLAGDAAHLMPPQLGEGMCSGLRDANALAWRLALVLDGRAGDSLLDSYSEERLPHVRALIEQSLAMGRVSCNLDATAASARDAAMREAGGLAPYPAPSLGDGVVYRGPEAIDGVGGRLGVQGRVRRGERSGRFDDVLGGGFTLLGAADDPAAELSQAQVRAFEQLGGQIVTLGTDVLDVDGALTGWLAAQGAAAVLIRPDFNVFGAVGAIDAVPGLLDELLVQVSGLSVPH